MPPKSCSSKGPMRKPPPRRTTRSMVSTSATRSARSRSASSPNGRLERFTRKPGPSAASMTRLPIASPSARVVESASCELATPAMTSTSFIRVAGLKKCMPTTRSGASSAPAIAVIGIDDVLEASTARGAASASSRNSDCLRSSFSGAASMTTSHPPKSPRPAAGRRRSSSPESQRPRSAPPASSRRPFSTPRSRASATGSYRSVSWPATQPRAAMSEPIVPAPTTPSIKRREPASASAPAARAR